MSTSPEVIIDGAALTAAKVLAVARDNAAVAISDPARSRLKAARSRVDAAVQSGQPHYGINTGFGSLARQRIDDAGVREVQRNLIRSHASGVGPSLDRTTARAMLVLLLGSLCRGHSGIHEETVSRIADLLNHDITPVIPALGSVGASGDLAPLAHAALALIGEGPVTMGDVELMAHEAMSKVGLTPIELDAKEGLALINGTHLMAALAVLALDDTARLFDSAVMAAALSIDACLATDTFLDARLHEARMQHGQIRVAERMRRHLAGSEMVQSHKEDDPRVQDPYSLRCTPQVLGAVADTIDHVRTIVERELGAVTDNPLVFDNGDILSGGNFHGMPLAVAMDTLGIAIAHIAGISERRTYFLLAATDSENPINPYLSPQPGLHSGLMITQYTAAACCNEIQGLAKSASVANIPTSAGQEDYNSFGPTAGYNLRRAIDLAHHVIAIEFLCSAEAMEYHRPLRSGHEIEKTVDAIRAVVPRLTEDRPPAPDIETIVDLIRSGQLR